MTLLDAVFALPNDGFALPNASWEARDGVWEDLFIIWKCPDAVWEGHFGVCESPDGVWDGRFSVWERLFGVREWPDEKKKLLCVAGESIRRPETQTQARAVRSTVRGAGFT